MTWHTKELESGNLLILDGERRIGTILQKEGRWHVQIFGIGPDGSIQVDVPDYVAALAYIQGVESAIGGDIVKTIIALLPDNRYEGLAILDAARRMVERFKR